MVVLNRLADVPERYDAGEGIERRRLTSAKTAAVSIDVKVVLRTPEPYESTSANPLGADRAPHRMWSWADGSWVLVKLLDDGAAIATTSPGLSATIVDGGARWIVHVERAETRSEAQRESV